MALQWTSDLSTSVGEIDHQHQELFQRVNSLLTALDAGKGREEIDRTVSFLTEYVVFHFGNEERYMAQYGYMNSTQHKAQHEQFVKAFSRLKRRFAEEGPGAPLLEDTKQLVVDWLVNHIKYSDKALGLFLKRQIS